MTEVEIIQLNPSEWQLYKTIRLDALQTDPSAFGSSYASNIDSPDDSWANRLADAALGQKQWFVFAKVDGQIIGMMGAYRKEPSAPAAHITAAFVKPKYRGMGVGKKLMTSLMDRIAHSPSIEKCELEVNATNQNAIKLYENLGFHKVRTQKMILGDGVEYDCLAMEKKL